MTAVTSKRPTRRRARKKAAAPRTQAKEVLERLPTPVIQARDGVIVLINAAARALFGRTERELLGQPIYILVAPSDRPLLAQRYEGRLRGEQVIDTYELDGLRADGSRLRIELKSQRVGKRDTNRNHHQPGNITPAVRSRRIARSRRDVLGAGTGVMAGRAGRIVGVGAATSSFSGWL